MNQLSRGYEEEQGRRERRYRSVERGIYKMLTGWVALALHDAENGKAVKYRHWKAIEGEVDRLRLIRQVADKENS